MKWESPTERIVRYLAKVDPQAPEWATNPHVQRVLTDGEIDLAKVAELFQERGIVNAGQFNAIIVQLRNAGDLDANDKLTPAAKAHHESVKAQYMADVAAIGPDITKFTPAQKAQYAALKNKDY